MYSSHSKDINRNKSFHPLTFANLRKVEVLEEKEQERQVSKSERQKELERSQEEERYQELIGGEGSFQKTNFVKNIFAAEYEAENAVAAPTVSASTTGRSLLKKFIKDESDAVPAAGQECRKRGRVDDPADFQDAPSASSSSEALRTGFLSTSEAFRMKMEREAEVKDKLDPLRKVKAHEDQVVAAAARKAQAQQSVPPSAGKKDTETADAIRRRVLDLIQRKK
eukprot:gene4060-2910_t